MTVKLVEPLSAAIQRKDAAAVKKLLDQGAPPDAPDNKWRIPLSEAAELGQTKIVALLLEHDAKWDYTDRRTACKPLMMAVKQGDMAMVKVMLAHHVDPDYHESCEDMPLHAAAASGNAGMVRLLLANGAHTSIRGKGGLSAADVAERHGHRELARLLR